MHSTVNYARNLIESTGEWENPPVSPFAMRAFHAELEAERRAQGLNWTQLAAEINRLFESTPSIPIHPATLRDMLKQRSVTSVVVLKRLRDPAFRARPVCLRRIKGLSNRGPDSPFQLRFFAQQGPYDLSWVAEHLDQKAPERKVKPTQDSEP